MKLLAAVPTMLLGRGHPNSVPVECDCGASLMWERKRGDAVRCPDCKRTETLPVTEWKPEKA